MMCWRIHPAEVRTNIYHYMGTHASVHTYSVIYIIIDETAKRAANTCCRKVDKYAKVVIRQSLEKNSGWR